MFNKMTPLSKLLVVVLVAGGGFYGLRSAAQHGLIPTPGIMKALVPEKAVLPELKDAQVQNVTPAPLPIFAPASVEAPNARIAIWEWNAQDGLILANGGPRTTKGSLMEKHKVNLTLYRQDDTSKMQEDLIACAKEIHDGAKQCTQGANYVIIMGDGAGQFLAAINPQLEKLGPEYTAKVIGATGYSRGEDSLMAKPEVKNNPKALLGALVEGVLRDGDWNIALKYIGDNGLKNNPDEKTWDADAVNWVNASDYNVAAADYVAGKCEDRKVVKDGHLTGETKHVCVDAVVTWTPGDVTVAQKKGGLVKIVSSREYRSQMPAVIVGPSKFSEDNRREIEGLLAATFEGGDQVKAFDQALHKASELSAKVYDDQDEAYWYKYFKGVVETDAQGNKVSLGGSAVNNLADNLILFGLVPGTNDNFKSTYTTFARIATQQYPALFEKTPIPDVRSIEDKSFVTGAQALMNDPGAAPDVPTFVAQADTAPQARVVSKRSYSINFDTGKASLTPAGVRQLQELKDGFAITGLFIRVDGYTDNTGDEYRTNRPLSEARAKAIQDFLQRTAPENFPDTRFAVAGHGSQDPVAPNTTASGRAANRRVQISLVDTGVN
jgi:outer membrane protein OmpA-like peptidoglycan-associated protein